MQQQAPHATPALMPPHRTPPRTNLCAAWKAHTQLLRSALSADATTSLSDPHHRLPQASHTITNPARLAHLVSGCLQLYKDSFDSANETTHSALASISGVDCSPLEAAFMWLGGWRPTSAITLVYSTLGLNGHEIVLTADRSSGQGQELEPPSLAAINQAPPSIPDSSLSDAQLAAVEALQRSTVDSELHLSNELATLQMLLPDQAMAEALTNDFIRKGHELMESKVADLAYLYAKANQLRLHTLEELLNLLNPMQSALCCVSAFELVYALKSLD